MSAKKESGEKILSLAKRVIEQEGKAVLKSAVQLDVSFCNLVNYILQLQGRVAVSGVGKSGIVGMKIAATLASTGTPAFFLKPLDAVHGDLGMLSGEDLLLALSNSGETQEILHVVFAAKELKARIAGITHDRESTLAREADIVLTVGPGKEACPLGLAPTSSTTVALAVGDALAMTLLQLRGFSKEQYVQLHPGGNLGRRLSLRVADFARTGNLVPVVDEKASLKDALTQMTEKETLGVTLVRNGEGVLTGILTDGDLRRILRRQGHKGELLSQPVENLMTTNPVTVERDAFASEALRIMEVKGITSLATVDTKGRPDGIVHLHDILGRSKFLV